MTVFQDVLNVIEKSMAAQVEGGERARGTAFEQATKYFLTHDSAWAPQFSNVWMWSEKGNPLLTNDAHGQPHNLPRNDTGIDLVARGLDGSLWAIQCKYVAAEHVVDKADISTFFTAAFARKVEPGHLIIVHTGAGLTKTLYREAEQFGATVIDSTALDGDFVDWTPFLPSATVSKFSPRPYQRKAIDDCLRGFETHDRGKLIMACGTGKTLTALRLAEEMKSRRDEQYPDLKNAPFRVLFLAPSIALVSQTFQYWTHQAMDRMAGFVVCSDETANRRRSEDNDAWSSSVLDVPFPTTTDAATLKRNVGIGSITDGLSVVFSTYQSICATIDAQRMGMPEFDLVVCDEAHRTAGTSDNRGKTSPFVLVHNAELLKSRKRLYMTATPKVYADAAKDQAKRADYTAYSMDNEAVFGPEFHRLKFGSAVEQGILSDYRVLVLGVAQGQASNLQEQMTSTQTMRDEYDKIEAQRRRSRKADRDTLAETRKAKIAEQAQSFAGKIVGAWNGLLTRGVHTNSTLKSVDIDTGLGEQVQFAVMGNQSQRQSGGETRTETVQPLRRAVAFTRRIADSKALADGFNDVIFQYLEQQIKSGHKVEGLLKTSVKHVDGSMPARKRNDLLSWLGEPPDEDECRMLSNAKCLTEGVDLPQLDAVIFFQPRASQVDIVQAVGRVMRKAENKKYGYIILPVVVPEGSDANDVLASSDFETVWKILQSLRSHDERLDARINALSLHRQSEQHKRQRKPGKSNRVGRGDYVDQDGIDEGAFNEKHGSLTTMVQGELRFDKQISENFQARLVQKCGDTAYWDDWADSVAKIAKTTVEIINNAVVDDAQVRTAFNIFLQGLRDTLNPGIDRDDAIGMLAQHILTAPIFDALFAQQKDQQGRSFVQANPVSQALEPITKLLEPLISKADPQHDLSELYAQVRLSASAVHSDESARQTLVKNLYESFFRNAFKDDSKKLGIVYTPIEIVDYIIHAVDRQLSEHFGKHIGDRGVTILDPFTGTGTFIVELLRSGLIPAENLRYKYEHEIYANEIMLLAYYIAMVNIESAFYSVQMELAKSGKVGDKGNSFYVPFPGGVLTDTFQTSEDNDTIDQSVFMANSERVQRENEQPITVIFGNPPYSAGQKSANENNANDHYETLDSRIEETYVATSSSSNKRQIYDSYIRAFRWSSDRIAGVNRDGKGIIGFVSNGGWLYSIAFNGFRKALCNEFSDIYVFNLRGNALGKGIERKKESGNVFGGGTRTSIAITLLIRDQEADHQGIVHYRDIGDYLSRDEKLATIDESADGEEFEWQILIPDEHGDWLSQRDDSFDNYAPLALGKRKRMPGMFATYSLGINTNRDAFCYGFSFNEVQNNIQRLLKTYNSELSRWIADGRKQPIGDFVVRDAHLIKWSSSLYQLFAREKQLLYSDEHLVYSLYRPFTKKWLYYDGSLIHRIFRNLSLFPPALSTSETTSATGMHIQRETALPPFVNRVIDVSGVGNTGFSCLISEETVCLDAVQKGQCFPLYWYEVIDNSKKVPEGELDLGHASLLKPGDLIVNDSQGKRYIRHDAITDDTLRVFRAAYPDNRSLHAKDVSAAKECIFYYAYGLLHSPEYRERFSANLRKELPRIPFAADFDTYQLAGRRLATLHVEYENVERYVSTENGQDDRIVEDWSEDADHSDPGRVQKLQFGRTTKSEDNPQGKDRSTIIINDKVSLRNIPEEAYRYKVSGRSAIEWVMDQYRVKTDRASGITNDPNDWVRESGNPRYIIDLLESVVTVSIETMKIVDSLPPINAQDKPSFWPLGW